MTHTSPASTPAPQTPRAVWECPVCHQRLGTVIDGGLCVVARNPTHYPDRIEVRCPGCRRGYTYPIARLTAPHSGL